MKRLSVFVIAIWSMLLLLSQLSVATTNVYGNTRVTGTPSVFQYLPLLSRNEKVVPTVTATPTLPTTDTQPPDIMEWSIEPDSVNIGRAEQYIWVRTRIVDDLSGVRDGYHYGSYTSPSGQQEASLTIMTGWSRRLSGTPRDGWYLGWIEIPRYSEPGTWTLTSVGLSDSVGHHQNIDVGTFVRRGFPTTFRVISDPSSLPPPPGPDTKPPEILSAHVEPDKVREFTEDRVFQIILYVEDDASGLHRGEISFLGPGVDDRTSAEIRTPLVWDFPNCVTFDRGLEAMCYVNVLVDRYMSRGMWRLQRLTLNDVAGKTTEATYEDLSLEFEAY